MKRVVLSVAALVALLSSRSAACDRVVSRAVVVSNPAIAVAVPLVVEDAGYFSSAHVLAAPVVSPLVVVQRPLFAPRAQVRVFALRKGVRVFVR
jgi:hypothetical protein